MRGRADAQAAVDRLIRRAHEGAGALLVLGEAGMGKTEVCRWAAGRAARCTLVETSGAAAEADLPLAGLSQIVRPLGHALEGLPAPQRDALAAAVGNGPPVVADRFALGVALLGLLGSAAERAPVLVVVDDVHWFDPTSLDALLFAGRRLLAEHVALLLAARPAEGHAVPSVFETVELSGLDVQDVAELLGGATDAAVDLAVADELRRATGGNPLALIELATLLSDGELSGRVPLPEPLPIGRRAGASFAPRVHALPDTARVGLALAAAAGRLDSTSLAGALDAAGLPEDALDPALASGLVTLRHGRVEFVHPLTRSAAYQAASPDLLRSLHRSLAQVSHAAGDIDRQAWHLAAAVTGPDEEAASALELAGMSAVGRGGFAAAAEPLRRAAELTPADGPKDRRSLQAAVALFLAGRNDEAMEAARSAFRLTDDPLVRADAVLLQGQMTVFSGSPSGVAEGLGAEAERVAPHDPARASSMLVVAASAALAVGRGAECLPLARRALDAAQGDRRAETIASIELANALVMSGRAVDAAPVLDAAIPALMALDQAVDGWWLFTGALTSIFTDRFGEARRITDHLLAVTQSTIAPTQASFALSLQALLESMTGSWTAAYATETETLRLRAETGLEVFVGYDLAYLARMEANRGMEDDCRRHVAEIRALGGRYSHRTLLVYASAIEGLLELTQGRPAAAVDALLLTRARWNEMAVREQAVVPWRQDLIEALVGCGRTAEAEAALEEFDAEIGGSVASWVHAANRRCHGLARDDDDAFDAALDLHTGSPVAFEMARTQLCAGERGAGRRPRRAAELLHAAAATFDGLGARPWAHRARRALVRLGQSSPNRPAVTDDLTPQELQVALLVAGGATNKETAARLFLSTKTVEFHLSRVYRKLGVASRSQLAHLLAPELRTATEEP